MAHDEELAERIREAMSGVTGTEEKRMFGGLAFLIDGHMAIAANSRGEAMVRVDPDTSDRLCGPHVSVTVMRGRPMRGWVDLAPAAVSTDAELATWVQRAMDFVRTLPAK